MQKDPGKLLEKYKAGNCNEEEKAIVESWYLDLASKGNAPAPLSIELSKNEVWASLTAGKPQRKLNTAWWWGIAAAITLLVGAAGFFRSKEAGVNPLSKRSSKHDDIAPGGNKAFLTLADGTKISLTDAGNGEIAKQQGLSIQKTADGQLVYAVDEKAAGKNGMAAFNAIETPKGGQYQINLPDGTRVWLNAASSLRYPTKFSGDTRKVTLNGEGYFEVAKIKGNTGKRMPFIVKTGNQEVEVLGTHFNINSYDEEDEVKTTLLEGSVRVSVVESTNGNLKKGPSKLLKPGEQSQLRSDAIAVKTVDTETIMAWKNGDFVFKGDDLKSIMKKVSRWYDVEVIYKGNFDQLKFGGYISRSKNISSVLGIMESTGKVHFSVEGKKVIVLK
ncbi:FecR family protein [Pedobacter heparinus]|uniref:FecR family protein n=1 Tax=Pedobacter heparinus TaxID=984 RepID=UPI00292FC8F9|nr:FecR family protein [Pedobacter heparinus]